ncbi:MAG: DUF5123 domain-containing protein [Mucilaginibacter sp.]|uniref:DUF5123 domain-containing protein n=1 Tax=Mucilaginibacter sp. TaxID=1882438 RepID=UPI0032649F7C
MKTRYFILTICAAMMLLAAACKKSDSLSGVPDRLFRPVLRSSLLAPDNSVTAEWQKIDGAAHYTVQLSRDTFKHIDATLTIDSSRFVFANLKWEQQYQVQVRAIATDTTKNSKYSILGSIKTPKFPTIVTTPTLADVTESAIKLRWTNSGDAVTTIKVLKTDSSVVKIITLTSTNITNQYYDITGLTSSTGYIVQLYSGAKLRGWNNYITQAPLSGVIIDLRGIDLTKRTTILADTIPLIANGATVVLQRGAVYNVPVAINLSKSIKIISGSDLSVSTNATINISGGSMFAIVAASTIPSIAFEGLTLTGTTGNYVFNINTACNIGTISYEGCTINTFRGVNRTQSVAIVITTLSMNNCLISNIIDYGLMTVSNATIEHFDNIILSNSTINTCEKLFVSKSNSINVTINDNTFYASPLGGGSYYLDYNGVGITGTTTIKNNIFGVGKPSTATPPVYTVNGKRGTITDLSQNNYSTSDFVLTTSSTGFSNTIPYTKLSTDLWVDPANGNFKFKDATYAGKGTTGDPRWR